MSITAHHSMNLTSIGGRSRLEVNAGNWFLFATFFAVDSNGWGEWTGDNTSPWWVFPEFLIPFGVINIVQNRSKAETDICPISTKLGVDDVIEFCTLEVWQRTDALVDTFETIFFWYEITLATVASTNCTDFSLKNNLRWAHSISSTKFHMGR